MSTVQAALLSLAVILWLASAVGGAVATVGLWERDRRALAVLVGLTATWAFTFGMLVAVTSAP